MESENASNELGAAPSPPGSTTPAPQQQPLLVLAKRRRPRSTGRLLGRDLPQTPEGMLKRPWGRSVRKVDALLPRKYRVKFDRLLADPRTTRKSTHEWLAAHGVKVSLGTVTKYRDAFDRSTHALREATRIAAWVVETAEEGKGEQIPSAAFSMVEQFVMQGLMRKAQDQPNGEPPDAALLLSAAKILSITIDARQKLVKVTRRLEKIRENRREAKTKVTPQDVAMRIREALGV